MKHILILLLFVVITSAATAQDKSIGIRLGDPSGLTYKKYFRNTAAEFIAGTASSQWHHRYYRNSFNDFSKFDGQSYRNHIVESSLYLQARYLARYDFPVSGMTGNWEWYWGLGGMFKVARIDYGYREGNFNNRDTHTDIDLGPEAMGGIEYTFEQVPLTIFGEISVLMELADRPFIWQPFGAAGLRYRFKRF